MSNDEGRLKAAEKFVRGVIARNGWTVPEKRVRKAIIQAAKAVPPFTTPKFPTPQPTTTTRREEA